jgi:antagonist of KipI
MSVIHVQSPGLLTTVQDLGRPGFSAMGVSASGAADGVSLRIGNRLVGNPDGAAALECTLLGGAFLFPQGAGVALAGSDFGATLDGAPVGMWQAIEVRSGQTLCMGPTRSGARCYLCVHGGIAVKAFLGSASTHLLSGLGGFEGRALRTGDVLTMGSGSAAFRSRTASRQSLERLAPRRTLRVTPGPQSDWFRPALQERFFASTYRVSEESDRVGLRLAAVGAGEGTPVPSSSGGTMITEGVSLGAIQIPPGGQPIIVFVEQQTTGGYPKIANIISADLAGVGQLRPRDEIRFERAGWDVARELLLKQEALLRSPELIFE